MCGSIHATARNTPDPKAFCGWLGNMPPKGAREQDVKRALYLEMSAFEALLSYREAPTGTLCQIRSFLIACRCAADLIFYRL
jgi:hypothetical protein